MMIRSNDSNGNSNTEHNDTNDTNDDYDTNDNSNNNDSRLLHRLPDGAGTNGFLAEGPQVPLQFAVFCF